MNLNKYKYIVFSLVAGGLLWVGLLLLLNGTPQIARADPGDLFVTVGGSGDCSQANPCGLQTALGLATVGDAIYMAGGIYTGSGGAVVTVTHSVILYGGWDGNSTTPPVRDPTAYPTTLDGEGARRGVYIGGSISPTLDGLHITRGDATGLGGYEYYGTYDAGGGVYVITAAVTLADNRIFSNTASYGAGVFLGYSPGALNHNMIFSNTAATGGGGIMVYEGAPTLNGNTVSSNTSYKLGGGLYLFSTQPNLLKNVIAGNRASTSGGGISVASCSPILTGNVIIGNTARQGGGIILWYSHSPLTNNVLADNKATTGGSGSGLWIGGSELSLWHTTLARNTGGNGSGVCVTDAGSTPSSVSLTNTLLVSHTVGISITADSAVTVNGVLWHSTPLTVSQASAVVNVLNQHIGDPFFDVDGYHLTSGSAAIDKAVWADILSDIDEQLRFPGTADLGADEYWTPGFPIYIYLPIITRNP